MAASGFFRSNEEARLKDISTMTAVSGRPKAERSSTVRRIGTAANRRGHHAHAARRDRLDCRGGETRRHPYFVHELQPGAPVRRHAGQFPRPVADDTPAPHQRTRQAQQCAGQHRRVDVQRRAARRAAAVDQPGDCQIERPDVDADRPQSPQHQSARLRPGRWPAVEIAGHCHAMQAPGAVHGRAAERCMTTRRSAAVCVARAGSRRQARCAGLSANAFGCMRRTLCRQCLVSD